MPKNYYVFIITIISALSGILFGYDTGVISGAILFLTKQFHLSSVMNGIVVSSVLVGACVGALCSGRLTDHLGRKKMLIMDAALFIVGTLITAHANTISILIAGRIAVGIAIGIASFTAPLYISEIAPKEYRGALVSLNQLAIAAGIFISYLVDYYFSHQADWRWMFAVGVIPAFILMIGMFFLPYSPRWMAQKGNYGEAFRILNKLRLNPTLAEIELREIIDSTRDKKNSWRALFHQRIRKTVIIGVGLALIQQLTGINTILYYAPTIFQTSGFTAASSAILASIGIGVVFLVFTVVGLMCVDKIGRKPLLYAGVSLMGVALLIMSIAFQLNSALFTTKIVLLCGTLLYVMAFAFSLGPICWLMIAEIFPTHVRGFGASIATFFNWASNGLVAVSFVSCVEYIGKSNTFLIFCISCVLSLIFIYYCVPETKRCSLEQLEWNLMNGKGMRQLGEGECI